MPVDQLSTERLENGRTSVPDPTEPTYPAPSGSGWKSASAEGPQPFVYNPGAVGAGDAGTPITESGPLAEDEPEGIIPPSPLWAMKLARHFQWSHLLGGDDGPSRIRRRLGAVDDTLYVIDDGHHHCIVGRHLGQTADGCSYSLVARVPKGRYEALSAGTLSPRDLLAGATGRAIYGVVDDGPASNVFLVGTFGAGTEIPDDYLPPHPPIDFPADLDDF